MGLVRTIVVSDLHLGAKNGADVARLPPVRERLLEALGRADRVVLLGDVLELREMPLRELLPRVQPFFEAAAEAVDGKPVTLMAGNHDHAVAEPHLTRGRLDGTAAEQDTVWPVDRRDG